MTARNLEHMMHAFVMIIVLSMSFCLNGADSQQEKLEDIEVQAKEAFKNAQQCLLADSGNQNVLRATRSGNLNLAMNAYFDQERNNQLRRKKFQEYLNQGSQLMQKFGSKWCELLSTENCDIDGGKYMSLKKFKNMMKNATTGQQMIDCNEVLRQQRFEVYDKFKAMEFMTIQCQLISLLDGLGVKIAESASKLPVKEQRIYKEYLEQSTQNLQQMASIVSTMNPPSPIHLTPVDTSIKLPKKIRSMSHCDIHGYDYDLAQGCPGCKGNVDYGGGKTVRCNRHNVNYNSKLGCPWCAWPR